MVRHLYVHIPFCHRICPYCSFHKHTPGGHDLPAFFRAIIREAAHAREKYGLDSPHTIYFGGGTPTLPGTAVLAGFLEEFGKVLGLDHVVEWTFEANPRTFDLKKIALLRDHGVTRVSLGVQAWDDATLVTLGRDHSPAEAEQAYEILRAAEIPVVSLDLMFSIPGQSLAAWQGTLDRTVSLRPDHVSAYNLNYEEDTEFFERFKSGEYTADEDTDVHFFESAIATLATGGLDQYEISNYARPGFESIHNQAYWDGADYIGLGPGAFSTVGGRRWKNVAHTSLYTELAGDLGDIEREVETLTPDQLRTERVALLLRTRGGLPKSLLGTAEPRIDLLIDQGLAVGDDERIVLTPRGRLVADSVAGHLLAD